MAVLARGREGLSGETRCRGAARRFQRRGTRGSSGALPGGEATGDGEVGQLAGVPASGGSTQIPGQHVLPISAQPESVRPLTVDAGVGEAEGGGVEQIPGRGKRGLAWGKTGVGSDETGGVAVEGLQAVPSAAGGGRAGEEGVGVEGGDIAADGVEESLALASE